MSQHPRFLCLRPTLILYSFRVSPKLAERVRLRYPRMAVYDLRGWDTLEALIGGQLYDCVVRLSRWRIDQFRPAGAVMGYGHARKPEAVGPDASGLGSRRWPDLPTWPVEPDRQVASSHVGRLRWPSHIPLSPAEERATEGLRLDSCPRTVQETMGRVLQGLDWTSEDRIADPTASGASERVAPLSRRGSLPLARHRSITPEYTGLSLPGAGPTCSRRHHRSPAMAELSRSATLVPRT